MSYYSYFYLGLPTTLVHFCFVTFAWYFWMSCIPSVIATCNVTDIAFFFFQNWNNATIDIWNDKKKVKEA